MESKKDVYVISLDAVDLNTLPISQKPNDGRVVPLWSKSNLDLRNNEYYEFEIKTNDTKGERNYQVIENVICHICDINVPKVYFNEHKKSFRHKFNAKIADIALRRLQLFMNKDDVNESDEKIPSKHYCSECSLVIDSDDEISHKQSIVHRNSIFLEKFLNDFLKFYTNDEHEINDSKEDSKKIEVAKQTKHCEDSKKDFDSDEPNISETALLSDSKTDRKNSKSDLHLEGENKKLDSSSILHKALLQVKDEVVFETVDGGKFKATEMNFNALMKISTLFEYCMICYRIFVTEKHNLHLNSDLHSENLLKKLPDKNCIRKVNNTHNHCILCNNYFTNYEIHVHSKEHITNFHNMIIPDKCKKTAKNCYNFNTDKINVETKSYEYSDILKNNKSKNSTDTHGHKAPLNKKTDNKLNIFPSASLSVDIPEKLFCDSCNVWISVKKMKKHQNTMKHTLNTITDYHYLLKYVDKDNLFCKICDVTISNIYDDIQDHFTNLDHINKYDKLLQAHNITKSDDITYYCKECKVYVLHKNEYLHIETKQHKDKISFNKIEEIDEYTKTKIDTGNAVNFVELGNGNAIETVETSNAVNVELDNGYAIKTVEPGNAVNVELGDANSIKTDKLVNAVIVELGNDNAIKSVEPGNAVNVELGNGNAIETVKPGNAVNVELGNGNAIETVEPGNALNVKLGNGNAIKTVEPGNADYVELGNGNANQSVEPIKTVNVEPDHGNAIKSVEPVNAVNIELDHGNAIKSVALTNAVNVELDHGNAIKTAVPGNATDNKVVANGKALETVDKFGRLYIPILDPITGKDIRTFQSTNVSEIIETAEQSKNTVKPESNSYFCNLCQVQVPNNVNNISMHNKGRPHMLKLRQQVDTKVKEKSNLHYQMVETDTKNVVTCIVCDVDITVSDKIISTHIEGETHKNNYSEFCTRNLLVIIDNAIYCTVCGVNPGVRCEFSHCIGKKHKKNLENIA